VANARIERAAEEAAVLLDNDRAVLPMSADDPGSATPPGNGGRQESGTEKTLTCIM
jgi:hypothetical protein